MTADQLARRWARRSQVIEGELRKTLRGIGISAVKFTKERMQEEIYAIPEDMGPGGKKKWIRTHLLYRSERWEMGDNWSVRIVNDAAYSEPRHEAGKPGHRRINPLRVSHWRDELLKVYATIMPEALRITIEELMRRY